MQRHTPLPVLATAPLLAAYIGLSYRLGDPVRTSAPSFDAAREIAPLSTWGWLFIAGAVALTVALLSHKQVVGAWAYFIGGVVYAWWAACFAVQALTDPQASLVGWALYAVIAMTHFVVGYRCWINR